MKRVIAKAVLLIAMISFVTSSCSSNDELDDLKISDPVSNQSTVDGGSGGDGNDGGSGGNNPPPGGN